MSLARRLSPPWLSSVDLVRSVYAEAFDARVLPDPDYFIVAEADDAPALDEAGGAGGGPGSGGNGPPSPEFRVAACAGVTLPREDAPFFAERYLDAPVEELIRERLGTEARRDRIVEIGPLASGARNAGREVVRLTPIIAWCMGMQHILCTVTGSLSVLLDRVGIGFVPFAPARVTDLDEADRERWGSYYDDDPWTGVIALDQLSQLFSQVTGQYRFIDLDLDLGLAPGPSGQPEVLCRAAD